MLGDVSYNKSMELRSSGILPLNHERWVRFNRSSSHGYDAPEDNRNTCILAQGQSLCKEQGNETYARISIIPFLVLW